ncbi:hypothetical protein KL942_002853 [Ogataea angusta]|uniref:TRIP4/RQT4 C2HC5-type zinc finger domain-containing protein n=1 Tax=Pichia angusta TaxID=870730 RepID=A0AAN6DE37_PICAN|nr:uncharacterized protein KL928_003235 [Ogataea angusta]KAG7818234.1 hypothetical protein KL928_003235 [Ogataea angusta]KAG7840054.1 hypothetical protein KL942_002853 [Ogataea angusta]KAG7844138.1 hypothetical protein KL941_004087 [Ogataea angusta]KAG7847382.1 hypothetical protein KL940_003718 [Ogataea angusta]
MVDYAVKELKTPEAASQHFINLLGESPDALEFISEFSRTLEKPGEKSAKKPSTTDQNPKKNVIKIVRPGTKSNAPKKAAEESRSRPEKNLKLDNLKELGDALNELESQSGGRVCNCNATRHPLFEMFPNCLNCGKIICVKEGLQPCSFCGKDLLSSEERRQIAQVLQKEKDELNGVRPVVKEKEKPKKNSKITISVSSAGQNNFKVQDQLFKRIERKKELERENLVKSKKEQEELAEAVKQIEYLEATKGKDQELLQAEQRLDKLLEFQANGAQRTRIIDQASDFEVPANSLSPWASPVERALQLKKQQRELKRLEEEEKLRTGRGKRVLDMSIRDGKVVMREVATPETGSDGEMEELEQEMNRHSLEQLEKNAQTVWDYEQERAKWTKPKYMGKVDSDEPPEEVHGGVVQLGEDAEEILLGLGI